MPKEQQRQRRRKWRLKFEEERPLVKIKQGSYMRYARKPFDATFTLKMDLELIDLLDAVCEIEGCSSRAELIRQLLTKSASEIFRQHQNQLRKERRYR